MKHFPILSAALALLLFSVSLANCQTPETVSWKTFGNGPAHSGYYPANLGNGTFIPSWEKTFDNGVNPVVVYGPHVFYTIIGSHIHGKLEGCLDEATGETVWENSVPWYGSDSRDAPTYSEGKIYFKTQTYRATLTALDASSGKTVWNASTESQSYSHMAPAIFGTGMWIGGGEYGGMYGFDTEAAPVSAGPGTGRERFFVRLAQYDDWTPSFFKGSVFTWVNGQFAAWNPRTGEAYWKLEFGSESSSYSVNTVSAIHNDRAFLIGNSGLRCIDLRKRAQSWFVGGSFNGSPAVDQVAVYAVSGNSVKSYHPITGEFIRSYDAATPLIWQPIVTNDRILVSSSSETYIFDKASGALLQTLPKGGYLSYSSGRLFISKVYEFDKPGALSTYTIALSEPDPKPNAYVKPAPTPEPVAAPASKTKLIYKFAGRSEFSGASTSVKVAVSGYLIWSPDTDETSYLTLFKKNGEGYYTVTTAGVPWRVPTKKGDMLIFGNVSGSDGMYDSDPYAESLLFKGQIKQFSLGDRQFDAPTSLRSVAWSAGSDGTMDGALIEFWGVYSLDRNGSAQSNSDGETIADVVDRIELDWHGKGYRSQP